MKVLRAEDESLAQELINLLLPNRCSFCNNPLSLRSCICSECLADIDIIETNYCVRCGAPADNADINDKGHCKQCRGLRFSFNKNESLGIFDGKLRKLIHLFKFDGRISLYWVLSELAVFYKRSYILDHDVVIPVPLSPGRYAERGYNQSFLIGKAISRRVPIQFLGHSLMRKGRARPQSSIESLNLRLSNMTDRFILRSRNKELIEGKRILLLDDVLTTGATASKCARTLYSAGAQSVNLLSMARSVRVHA